MNRHTAILIAGSILTLDMALPRPAAAQPALLPVYLTVSNQAAVPADTLADAVAAVTRIYATIGVTVVLTGDTSKAGGRSLVLSIVPASRCFPFKLPASTLGTAIVGGTHAYVAREQVERFAEAWGSDVTTTLGLTIAHEVGHLLLGHGSHGETGLMSAAWNRPAARRAALGVLGFTPREAALIRDGLAVRR